VRLVVSFVSYVFAIESLLFDLFPNKKLPSFVRNTPAQRLVVADEIGK
jgi:hypothetical protein